MAIRINLLAEARALEELRRRDPVKRAVLFGVLVVLAVGAFSTWLQVQVMVVRRELNRTQGQIASRDTDYQAVVANQRRLADVTHRLGSLQELATNRLLYGTLFNALQHTALNDVQLTRFRADQSYFLTQGTKGKTNAEHQVTAGRPSTVAEKILLTLEARDCGNNPGDEVNKYKQAISESQYFKTNMGKTNEVRLANLSPPQALDGKPFVQFSLECRFPERVR